MQISDLNHDVLEIIREFVCEKPVTNEAEKAVQIYPGGWGFDEYSEQNELEWRSFLNTSKIFQEIKRSTIYLTLAGCYALRYLENQEFRDRVDNLVNDRQRQICILAGHHQLSSEQYRSWNGVHALVLSGVMSLVDVSIFSNLTVLSLTDNQVVEVVSGLSQLQVLHLNYCEKCQSITNLPNLKELYLIGLNLLTDISSVSHSLNVLEAHYCNRLFLSQSLLQRLKIHISLNPTLFNGIPDSLVPLSVGISEFISWISRLTSVELYHFHGLDLSLLSNIQILKLIECDRLRSVQNLPNLQFLLLNGCEDFHFLDFETLSSLQMIKISYCDGLINLDVVSPRILQEDQYSLPVIKSLVLLKNRNLKTVNIARTVLKLKNDNSDTILQFRKNIQFN